MDQQQSQEQARYLTARLADLETRKDGFYADCKRPLGNVIQGYQTRWKRVGEKMTSLTAQTYIESVMRGFSMGQIVLTMVVLKSPHFMLMPESMKITIQSIPVVQYNKHLDWPVFLQKLFDSIKKSVLPAASEVSFLFDKYMRWIVGKLQTNPKYFENSTRIGLLYNALRGATSAERKLEVFQDWDSEMEASFGCKKPVDSEAEFVYLTFWQNIEEQSTASVASALVRVQLTNRALQLFQSNQTPYRPPKHPIEFGLVKVGHAKMSNNPSYQVFPYPPSFFGSSHHELVATCQISIHGLTAELPVTLELPIIRFWFQMSNSSLLSKKLGNEIMCDLKTNIDV